MKWVGKEFNINKNINVKIDIMELGVAYHIKKRKLEILLCPKI